LTASLVTVWCDLEQLQVSDLTHAVEDAGQATHHQYLAVPVSLTEEPAGAEVPCH
jgi:hypothetical protein